MDPMKTALTASGKASERDIQLKRSIHPAPARRPADLEDLVAATFLYCVRLLGEERSLILDLELNNGGPSQIFSRVEIAAVALAMPFVKAQNFICGQMRMAGIEGLEQAQWKTARVRWSVAQDAGDWLAFNIGYPSGENDAFNELAVNVSISLHELMSPLWLKEGLQAFFENSRMAPQTPVGEIALLGDGAERNALLTTFARAESVPELIQDETLLDLFEATVGEFGSRTAVECGGRSLTYAELDSQAELVAVNLLQKGIGTGDLVGLFIERSVEAFVAMLGILKSGAAYVPLDPEYPADRVEYILHDSGAKLLLSQKRLSQRLGPVVAAILNLEDLKSEFLEPAGARLAPRPNDPAYVIYTSGSTGRPKGVMIEHRSICHLVRAESHVFRVQAEDRVYQGFSIAFDASLEEIWLAFFSGAALVAATSQEAFASTELARFLNEKKVTVFSTVPTILSFIDGELETVRLLILGGEAAPQSLVEKWSSPGLRLVNTYGPTEATVVATYSDCVKGERVTIGTGLPNLTTYILDGRYEPVPVGVPGELYLGGPCLARGYLGQPEMTAEKFIANPFAKQSLMEKRRENRLYRTGDLVRYTLQGKIEFLGRRDSQVKLRGFRIELSEIESLLMECQGVTAAAVSVARNPLGLDQLVAFVVMAKNAVFSKTDALEFLKSRLAAYMVPSVIEEVESLPLLPSGKLDRKSLPTPRWNESALNGPGGDVDVPRLTFEDPFLQLAYDQWTKLFGTAALVSENDNFFELGGHSLLAAKLISELRKNPDLASSSVVDVYRYPTLVEFAARLAEIARQTQESASGSRFTVRPAASVFRQFAFAVGQVVAMLIVVAVACTPLLVLSLLGWSWFNAGENMLSISLKLSALSFLAWPFYIGLAITAKWLLIGQYRAGTYPVLSWFYLRFWLCKAIESLVPLSTLTGTPFYNVYLRLMGARIGKNVFLGSKSLRIYDLLTIEDGATVEYEALLSGYYFHDGNFTLGPITIGRNAHVGTKASVSPDSRLEEGAELAPMSLLMSGQTIPAGRRWSGSPAQPLKGSFGANNDEVVVPSRAMALVCAGLQATVLLVLPFLFFVPGFLGLWVFVAMWRHFGLVWTLAATPLFSAYGVLSFSLEVALVKWLLLGRVRPGSHNLASVVFVRKWTVELLMQMHLQLCHSMYATLYLIPWLRVLGARIGRRVEVSTVAHMPADLLSIDDESFVADSACLGAPRIRRGRIELAETKIGRRTFIGNSAMVESGATLASNCLIGVLSTPPELEEERLLDGASWLGSPPLRLPRRQAAADFSLASTYSPTLSLYAQRLFIEFFRVTLPSTFTSFTVLLFVVGSYQLYQRVPFPLFLVLMPLLGIASTLVFVLVTIGLKWLLMGRYKDGEHPLWSLFVWKNELVTALHETFAVPMLVNLLLGTPFVAWYLRALGCKIGRGCMIQTTHFTEFDLVEIGDRVSLNEDCTVQTHLFEDRVFKQSNLRIGDDCSVGAISVVLYNARMEQHASLDSLSLVMKGEALPAQTSWAGIPVHKIERAKR